MKKRTHAITPTDRGPQKDKYGLYHPDDWQRVNPGYEYSPPRIFAGGRIVEVDGGRYYDASRIGKGRAE